MAGMFDRFQKPDEDPFNTAEALQYAQLGNPAYRQEAYDMRRAQNLGQAAIGNVVSAATGGDKRQKAAAELQELARTAQPGTEEFFTKAAQIMTKYGFLEEASQMQQRATELKKAGQTDIGKGEYERLLALQQEAMASGNTARAEAIQKRLDALNKEKGSAGTSELGKLIADQAKYPPGSPEHAAFQDVINAKRTGDKSKLELAEKRLDLAVQAANVARDRADLAREKVERSNAVSTRNEQAAYNAAKAKLQSDYDAAVELFNHPGFDKMFGFVAGRAANVGSGTGAESNMLDEAALAYIGPEGRAALALYKQVQGGAFLNALSELKQASANGSTGLGQVSNIEGEKVQSAKAALFARQDPADARVALKRYLDTFVNASQALDAKAQAANMQASPLQERQLTPAKAAPKAKPAALPKEPANRPTAGGWKAREVK